MSTATHPTSIHPTAVVSPGARIGDDCFIGPYCVVGDEVQIGDGVRLESHCVVDGRTSIGAGTHVFPFVSIGLASQDLKYKGEVTGLRIGQNNVFRENVTVNRATAPEHLTIIGSANFLMGGAHVAHDCELANDIIIANGAMLGGHVFVAEKAWISGNCLVHQFVRVGMLAMMQGGSAISKDLPPFTIARGDNGICGLNTVGLRRAGYDSGTRLELRRLYKVLFRGNGQMAERLAQAEKQFTSEAALTLIAFVKASKRGICRARGGEASDEADDED